MAHFYPWGYHLALDMGGLFFALIAVGLAIAGIASFRRARAALPLTLLVAATLLGSAVVHLGTMAPSASWAFIWAAYQESTGEERLARAAEIREFWRYGEMRESDWLRLSERWGVCHGMWPQPNCRRPRGAGEAQGIVREALQEVSQGRLDVETLPSYD
ncbi:hypothetical protein [Usitatibacter palustris]|uniref:hypothetical protein n=1 Tax=Usitatibacter palustris TaxID=2732487 RepID=UPI0014888443|nr:hypothetical protein [Usitatibacter palustris]